MRSMQQVWHKRTEGDVHEPWNCRASVGENWYRSVHHWWKRIPYCRRLLFEFLGNGSPTRHESQHHDQEAQVSFRQLMYSRHSHQRQWPAVRLWESSWVCDRLGLRAPHWKSWTPTDQRQSRGSCGRSDTTSTKIQGNQWGHLPGTVSTPQQAKDTSPTQRLLGRRCKMQLPTTKQLLKPQTIHPELVWKEKRTRTTCNQSTTSTTCRRRPESACRPHTYHGTRDKLSDGGTASKTATQENHQRACLQGLPTLGTVDCSHSLNFRVHS